MIIKFFLVVFICFFIITLIKLIKQINLNNKMIKTLESLKIKEIRKSYIEVRWKKTLAELLDNFENIKEDIINHYKIGIKEMFDWEIVKNKDKTIDIIAKTIYIKEGENNIEKEN